ncbi:hypothetical protein DPEC_G00004840 [Dallia pectoralis]|uniref:Uncharacterized protein n=1 Tax=Dallia pectoralis TaxID=75939 RepID=A0ACC2HJL4_DALPE|nr:hypothetical protein DPEC_G00004840 [Dallia pectoralis]
MKIRSKFVKIGSFRYKKVKFKMNLQIRVILEVDTAKFNMDCQSESLDIGATFFQPFGSISLSYAQTLISTTTTLLFSLHMLSGVPHRC